MPDFDVLIRNGMLIDGNQTPRYQADLGIRDGRIAALGRLAKSSATREVDAGFSDGGAHTKTFTAGRFTTEIISEFVRDLEMCSLEHAHWRLSTLPAHVAGLVDRGTLELGKAADVIVYDLDALEVLPVEVAHDLPGGEWRRIQRARGYRYVFVNGELTLENDRETDARSGQVLRSH